MDFLSDNHNQISVDESTNPRHQAAHSKPLFGSVALANSGTGFAQPVGWLEWPVSCEYNPMPRVPA